MMNELVYLTFEVHFVYVLGLNLFQPECTMMFIHILGVWKVYVTQKLYHPHRTNLTNYHGESCNVVCYHFNGHVVII